MYGKLVSKSDNCDCQFTVSGDVGDIDHLVTHGVDFSCYQCGEDHGFRFEVRDDVHEYTTEVVEDALDDLDPIVNLMTAVDDEMVETPFMSAVGALHDVKFAASSHVEDGVDQ